LVSGNGAGEANGRAEPARPAHSRAMTAAGSPRRVPTPCPRRVPGLRGAGAATAAAAAAHPPPSATPPPQPWDGGPTEQGFDIGFICGFNVLKPFAHFLWVSLIVFLHKGNLLHVSDGFTKQNYWNIDF